MRTNIEIDDELMQKALRLSGLSTKRAVVEAGLRLLVRVKEQQGILRLAGKVHWEAGPDEDRRHRTARRETHAGEPAARPQRGMNARLVEEVLQANAPRALRPAEIRDAIRRDKGVAIAFTSIRNALGQLKDRRVAAQVGEEEDESKAWRWGAR